MTTVPILDLTISLVLIFFILSIICAGIVEWLNDLTIRQKRQIHLYKSISKALNDPLNLDWGELVYRHPEVYAMKRKSNRYPVYIATNTLANVISDLIIQNLYQSEYVRDPNNPERLIIPKVIEEELDKLTPIEKIKRGIEKLNPGSFKSLISSFLFDTRNSKNNNIDTFKQNISKWYDNYQDRVTGWYKNMIKTNLFWVGFIIALGLNINTITIVKKLLIDDELRNSLVETSIQTVQKYEPENTDLKEICPDCTPYQYDSIYQIMISNQLKLTDSVAKELSMMKLPIGWFYQERALEDSITKLQNRIELKKKKLADTLLIVSKNLCYKALKIDSCKVKSYKEKDEYKQCLCYCSATKDTLTECGKTFIELKKSAKNEISENEEIIKILKKDISKVNLFDRIWSNINSFEKLFWYIIGCLITAYATSMGSTFWFETLIKFTNIRNAGKRPKPADQKDK